MASHSSNTPKMDFHVKCPSCHTAHEITYESQDPLPCPTCSRNLVQFATDAFKESKELDQCPVCGCNHLYRQRDFNRKLGILLLTIGLAAAYFTYGISVLVLTLVDAWLYKRVGEVGCCYSCGSLFRSPEAVGRLQTFNLSLHDYYKNLVV